jgi:hypothetical protein
MGIQYVHQKSDSLLEISDELLKEHPFTEWWLDIPVAYDFVKSRPAILNGKKMRKDIITQFVKSVLEDRRAIWKQRLLMSAEFLHRTSPRTYRQQIEICLAIYLKIEQGGTLASIPFMLRLAELSIYNVQGKIRHGEEKRIEK